MTAGRCVKIANDVEPKPNTMTEILVSIAFFAAAFGIVFVVIAARNRERLSMIEKGVNPKDFRTDKTSIYGILKWALLLVGVGLGLFLGGLFETYTEIPHEAAYFACALFFGGLGLAIAYMITKKAGDNT
jgi:FtsH-binding integral membrane protein